MKIKPRSLRFLAAIGAACWLATPSQAMGANGLPACFGEVQPLAVSSQMPYALVTVDGRQGYFVLDFGATFSTIVPQAFFGQQKPRPAPGTIDRYDDFSFFGAWGQVRLPPGGQTGLLGSVPQAGIIGTDFLASHIYTLDYPEGRLHRARQGAFCADDALEAAGFLALSTRDYYADSTARLSCPRAGSPACPNVPAVPIRIGPVEAVAQLDTGYDDGAQPLSVNINVALFEALGRAGIRLQPRPEISLQLTTCQPGVSEAVDAWRLPPGGGTGLRGAVGSGGAQRARRDPLRQTHATGCPGVRGHRHLAAAGRPARGVLLCLRGAGRRSLLGKGMVPRSGGALFLAAWPAMTRKRIKTWHWILVAVALVFVVDWAIKRPDSRARGLNAVLEATASPALKAYPYPFRVLRVNEDGMAVMGTPRNFDVPARRVIAALYPDIDVSNANNPAFVEAQQTLAARQSEARAIVEAQPGIKGVKWELDRAWLGARGIDLPPP
jgi:hypothetical protein